MKKKKFPKEQRIFLGERLKFPKEKDNFPQKQCSFPRKGLSSLGRKATSLRKRLSSPWNSHVPNNFTISTISCWLLYRLATYHWKVLEEGYNFVVENISIKIHYKKKLRSHKVLNTSTPQGTWLFLRET
jgi:hypothetical protein